jgi:hypothetical protein
MMAASGYRKQLIKRKALLTAKYETMKSMKTIRLRRKLGDSKRVTESVVKAHLETDEELSMLKRRLSRVEVDEELSKGIQEAFRQRRDMIKALVDMNRTDTSRELWALEKVSKDKKLRATGRLLRERIGKQVSSDDDDDND